MAGSHQHKRYPIRSGGYVILKRCSGHCTVMLVEKIDMSDQTALCSWNRGEHCEWFKLQHLQSVETMPDDTRDDFATDENV